MIVIPCFNEENTLPAVLETIPKQIPGVSEIETVVVDDGSTDKTVEVAKRYNVDHVVSHVGNKGLAQAFATGIQTALEAGADIVVNTDGDNQYPQQSIPELIKPIMDGKADIVIGDRRTKTIKHFGPTKKILQFFGSWVVRKASGTKIPDAASGFRAYSREAVLNLNIVTRFSYCTETIIQAGKRRISVTHVPVKTNPKTRESRLFNSTAQHVSESAKTIIRTYAMYEALRLFMFAGGLFVLIGVGGIGRFLYYFFSSPGGASGHIQSLVISGALLVVGFQLMMIGLLSDLVSINRKLIEDALYRLKKIELKK